MLKKHYIVDLNSFIHICLHVYTCVCIFKSIVFVSFLIVNKTLFLSQLTLKWKYTRKPMICMQMQTSFRIMNVFQLVCDRKPIMYNTS